VTESRDKGGGETRRGPGRDRRRPGPRVLWEAGPVLDRLIELRVFGRKPIGEVPPYSTDEEAADLVVAHLGRAPMRSMCLRTEDGWTFHWRKPSAASPARKGKATARYVRLVSAAGRTRPLAICRAALKLLGPIDAPEERQR
jgi:hypothetical protein